jgi:hypothetical protein
MSHPTGNDGGSQPPTGDRSGTARRVAGVEDLGIPRWVKVFAVLGLVVLVLIVVMLLTGHGPAQHMHHGLRLPTAAVLGQ